MLRIALAGASLRNASLASILIRNGWAEVVGVCDPFVRKAEWFVEHFKLPHCQCFANVQAMLDAVECEAVIVATTDAHHAEAAIPALRSGKYVFCEKPIETTLEKARAIIEADEQAGGRAFVGLNLRYAPVFETLKAQVEAGAVGRILTIQADEFYDGGRSYFRRWNRLRSDGGGLWVTKATHDFDLIYWLAERPRPLEVSAAAERTHYIARADAARQCRDCALAPTCPDRAEPPHPLARIREESGGEPYDLCLYNSDSDTFDHGVANISFEGGVLATYTCNVVCGFSDRRVRVSGTNGTLDGSLTETVVVLYRRDPSGRLEVPVGGNLSDGHGGADGLLIRSFLAFVRGEAEPRCRPREAAVSLAIGLAATQATDEHRVVPVQAV
jgi:predicted dehydrogenase